MERTFLRLRDVKLETGLSRSSIYRMIALHRFPAPVRIGERASAWLASEVREWCDERVRQSRGSVLTVRVAT